MSVLLISLFLYCVVFGDLGDLDNNGSSFNETQLSDQIHHSFRKVHEILKGVHTIHDDPVTFSTIEYDYPSKPSLLDYSVPNFWFNESSEMGNTQTFLPTPKGHNDPFYLATQEYDETIITESTSLYPPEYYTSPSTRRTPKYPGPGQYLGPGPYPGPTFVDHTIGPKGPFPPTDPDGITLYPGNYDPPDAVTSKLGISTNLIGPPRPPEQSPKSLSPHSPTEPEQSMSVPADVTPDPGSEKPAPSSTASYRQHVDDIQQDPTGREPNTGPPGISPTPEATIEAPETSATPVNSTVSSSSITTLHPVIQEYVRKWLLQAANLTVQIRQFSPTEKIPNYADDDVINEEPTLPERPDWIANAPEYKTKPPVTHAPVIRQGETFHVPPPESTAMAVGQEIILEDERGLLILGTTPEHEENTRTTIVADGRPANIPPDADMNWATVSTAGDVLHGEVPTTEPKDTWYDEIEAEMDKANVGYLSIFLIRMFHAVAQKKPEDLTPILAQAEPIATKLYNDGSLAHCGQPLIHVIMNVAIVVTETPLDELKSYAGMMYFMMRDRKHSVGMDVNSIIDYAETLPKPEEERRLLQALREFEAYPNATEVFNAVVQSPYELAFDIIEAFFAPYRRIKHSERGQRLVDSINYALTSRFPNLEGLRRHDDDHLSMKGQTSSTVNTHNQTIHSRQNYKINHRQKLNHSQDTSYIRQHRRSRIIRKRQRFQQNQRYSDFNYERALRRNLYIPNRREIITIPTSTAKTLQKRFNVITSAHGRGSPAPRTYKTWPVQSYVHLESRPTTDYKLSQIRNFGGNYRVPRFRTNTDIPLNFFHKLNVTGHGAKYKPYYRRSNSSNPIKKKHGRHKIVRTGEKEAPYIKNRFNEISQRKTGVNLKTAILRSIVEDSIYSDEEDLLKLNLISAMIHGNRTFHRKDVINETGWKPRAETYQEGILKHYHRVEAVESEAWTNSENNRDGALPNRI